MATVQRRNFPSLGTDAAAIAQLRTWLGWIDEEIATGKVNDEWSSGDASGHKMLDPNLPAERRRALILNDLSILDPGNYPREDLVPVTRTVPRYL